LSLLQNNTSITHSDPVLYCPVRNLDADSSALFHEKFEILKPIGQGGSGKVLKARQRNIDRLVAIKLLSPELVSNEKILKEFQLEARTISSLDHPNIVKVYSLGISADKRPYLVMDYLEGKSLATILLRNHASIFSVFSRFSCKYVRLWLTPTGWG